MISIGLKKAREHPDDTKTIGPAVDLDLTVETLVEIGQPAVESLNNTLKENNALLNQVVVHVLEQIGGPRSRELLNTARGEKDEAI